MSRVYFEKKVCLCPLCGVEKNFIIFNHNGHMVDTCTFELRSGNIASHVLRDNLILCDNCGYVFAKNEEVPKNAKEVIKTKEYKTCDGNNIDESVIQNYYKYAFIQLKNDRILSAFYAFLCGAWYADDSQQPGNAVMLRKKALEVYEMLDEDKKKNEGLYLVRADVLRRAGQFDKVIEEYSSFKSRRDDRNLIARIQIMLAKDKDDKCHYLPDYSALIS